MHLFVLCPRHGMCFRNFNLVEYPFLALTTQPIYHPSLSRASDRDRKYLKTNSTNMNYTVLSIERQNNAFVLTTASAEAIKFFPQPVSKTGSRISPQGLEVIFWRAFWFKLPSHDEEEVFICHLGSIRTCQFNRLFKYVRRQLNPDQ